MSTSDLPNAVWRGLFGEYRDLVAPTTEAPDAYHFGNFAIVLGATLARRIYVYYGRPSYPNFYICNIGTTALTRKGTAWSRGENALYELHSTTYTQLPSPLTIIPGISSAEGLMDCLAGDRKVLVIDEDEFRTILTKAKQEALSNLIPKLTSLYDCRPIESLVTRKRAVIAKEPFTSIATGSTKDWLQRSLQGSDIHGGFANRFIYLIGEPKEPMPFPPEVDKGKWKELLKKINQIRLWADGVKNSSSKGKIPLSEPAKIIFAPYYYENYVRCQGDSIIEKIIRRSPLHCMKFALLYAAIDHSTQIEEEHMEPAIEAARHSEVCAQSIFADFGESITKKYERKIEEMLREKGGRMPLRVIYRNLNITSGYARGIVSNMQKIGIVDVVQPQSDKVTGQPPGLDVVLLP